MRRIAIALIGLVVLVAPAVAQASSARPGKAVFAHGTSPTGEGWRATASVVKTNRHFNDWRFDLEFNFSLGFGWGAVQEIPIGGRKHMERQASGYTGILSGGAPESAAFGYAGPEVATIRMKMNDGGSLEVHPVLPPQRLRRKFVWMRGFRYFLRYYPGGAYVTEYWLYNRAGLRVGCQTHAEGAFGPSICGGNSFFG